MEYLRVKKGKKGKRVIVTPSEPLSISRRMRKIKWRHRGKSVASGIEIKISSVFRKSGWKGDD